MESTKYKSFSVLRRVEEVVTLVLDNRTNILTAFEILGHLSTFLESDHVRSLDILLTSGCDPQALQERVHQLEFEVTNGVERAQQQLELLVEAEQVQNSYIARISLLEDEVARSRSEREQGELAIKGLREEVVELMAEASSLKELSESQVLELIFLRECLREARQSERQALVSKESSKDSSEVVLSSTHSDDLQSLMMYDQLKLCEIFLA